MIEILNVSCLNQVTVEDRLQLTEMILQSLKQDISQKPVQSPTQNKKFVVRTFNLGQEVHINRDELYSERG